MTSPPIARPPTVRPPIVRPWSSRATRVFDLLRRFRQRLREPAFWGIQAGVAGVTVLHISVEAADLAAGYNGFASQLHHLPVTLYLIPVVAACYRYGMEGGMATGIWCLILSVPNMLMWHAGRYELLGELVFVLAVVAIGLVVAIPVERERIQRQRAEAVGHRLAFLNDAAAILSDTPHLAQAIERALAQLVSTFGLRGAAVVAPIRGGEDPVSVAHSPSAEARPVLEALADDGRSASSGWTRIVPVMAHGREIGRLAVLAGRDHAMTSEENAILSAVAGQVGVAVDNAGLHRQEERRLRSYVQRVTRAQEEERHRIARELHDETVQQLIVLARELDVLIQNCQRATDRERLQSVREQTAEILTGLRRFSRDLRPAMLDELGLVAALEWVASDLRDRTGIDVTFQIHGRTERLPGDVEVALFRIAQEAIRNVERHARARSVAVSAHFEPADVEVSVVDDGVGFAMPDTNGRAQPATFGVLGMQERARLLGGELRIASQPGIGTRVTARVPMG
jgi:signal transduction histidine kinase